MSCSMQANWISTAPLQVLKVWWTEDNKISPFSVPFPSLLKVMSFFNPLIIIKNPGINFPNLGVEKKEERQRPEVFSAFNLPTYIIAASSLGLHNEVKSLNKEEARYFVIPWHLQRWDWEVRSEVRWRGFAEYWSMSLVSWRAKPLVHFYFWGYNFINQILYLLFQSHWKCMQRHFMLQIKKSCIILTQVKGEVRFPLFSWTLRDLPFFKELPVLIYLSHIMHGNGQSISPGITIGIL